MHRIATPRGKRVRARLRAVARRRDREDASGRQRRASRAPLAHGDVDRSRVAARFTQSRASWGEHAARHERGEARPRGTSIRAAVTLLLLLRPVHVSLLETARRLAGVKETGPAVVVAQSALEVELEGALSSLLGSASIPPAIVEWITSQDVRGPQLQPAEQADPAPLDGSYRKTRFNRLRHGRATGPVSPRVSPTRQSGTAVTKSPRSSPSGAKRREPEHVRHATRSQIARQSRSFGQGRKRRIVHRAGGAATLTSARSRRDDPRMTAGRKNSHRGEA